MRKENLKDLADVVERNQEFFDHMMTQDTQPKNIGTYTQEEEQGADRSDLDVMIDVYNNQYYLEHGCFMTGQQKRKLKRRLSRRM